jgi:hypothetical protein
VLIMLVARPPGRVADRVGPRWLIGTGMTLRTGSLLLFATLGQSSAFWNILPASSSAASAWRS